MWASLNDALSINEKGQIVGFGSYDTGEIDEFGRAIIESRSFLMTPVPIPVSVLIDIKPEDDKNTINTKSKGVTPVAIFSTFEFDATFINPESLKLSKANVHQAGINKNYQCSIKDIDGDGLVDLLCKFNTADISTVDNNQNISLVVFTYSGEKIEGADQITITPM